MTEVINQARDLLVAVYTKMDADFEGSDLEKLRVHKFLNNKSMLFNLLPPTEYAFVLHVKWSALATLIDKTAHIAKRDLGAYEDYGWEVVDGNLVPVPSTQPAWPEQMTKTISCRKGCNTNCSCSTKGIPCYIGCH